MSLDCLYIDVLNGTVNTVCSLAFIFRIQFIISALSLTCVIDISHNSIFLL
jgi:hypothetical protein